MIEDFNSVKKELAELADVVNKFKSEAVQLKIVELVFGYGGAYREGDGNCQLDSQERNSRTQINKAKNRPKKKRPVKVAAEKVPKTRKSSGRPGPKAMIDSLLEEGFFQNGRTINEIIAKCSHDKAYQYKTSDFSPTLGRAVRANKVKRLKNSEGQYEYTAA